jgi:mRNA interferase MazF
MSQSRDVVLVSFPIDEENDTTKKRPAVIISNNNDNEQLDEVLLVPLTSNTTRAKIDPTQVLVLMNSPEGRQAGLRLDSVIDCTATASVPKVQVVAKIGSLPERVMEKVDQSIERGFDV